MDFIMTVILVLAFFLVFIVLDYFLNRRKAIQTVPAQAGFAAVPAMAGGDYVDGFQVPEQLSYHPGHSWLVRERKNLVRVGADEFAAALLGKLERIELPKPGQWIRQGQKVLSFYRDGEKTEMVSPTEGEVMEVNAEVLNNPGAAAERPLRQRLAGSGPRPRRGKHHPQPGSQGSGPGVDAGSRRTPLCQQPALAGAVAADGGRPAEDLLAALPDARLEGGDRRVLPHGVERSVQILLHIGREILVKRI